MQDNNIYYDNLSVRYDEICNLRKDYLESIDQEILNFLKIKNIKSILDVGLGDGKRATKYISQLNFPEKNFYGLEPSLKMYRKAIKGFNQKQNIINKNLESYETDKKFDLIMSLWNVIGHVSSLESFIKKISKLINQKGYFILDFNNIYNLKEYGLRSFLSNIILGLFKNKFSFRVFNRNTYTLVNYYKFSYIIKILSSNNFHIIKKTYINYKDGSLGNMLNGQLLLICKHESK